MSHLNLLSILVHSFVLLLAILLTYHVSLFPLQRDLKGHIGDVNVVQWFPSGKVVLSGGADLQLRVGLILSCTHGTYHYL